MNPRTETETERILDAFLAPEADRLSDRVIDAALAEIARTPQRRALRVPWRFRHMPALTRLTGIAAVALVAVVGAGALIYFNPGGTGGPGVQATPTPTPTVAPTPTIAPTVASTPQPTAFVPVRHTFGPDEGIKAPRLTVTIPTAGWSTDPFFAKGDEVNNLPEAAILPWLQPAGTVVYVYGDPCKWESTMPETPAGTVDEIVAALAAQASRDASEPRAVTVGGYAGKVITLHVPEDVTIAACEGSEFASFGFTRDGFDRFHQGPGQIDDVYVFDVGGAIVILDAMYRPNTPVELTDEMRGIVESGTFELP